jgi:YVTN family beta-propeller protein
MRRFQWVRGVVVLGLSGALVVVVPAGASAVPGRGPCRATAFVPNFGSGTVSVIDVRTRTKDPDITVGSEPSVSVLTPDGKTLFVTDRDRGTVSVIDVKTRTKDPSDIAVGSLPIAPTVTPDGKTVFVANYGSGTVSAIDVKSRTKDPKDITVGSGPVGGEVTPDGKTLFVVNNGSDTLSEIDVKPGPSTAPTSPSARNRSGGRSRPTARPPSSSITAAARCRRLT